MKISVTRDRNNDTEVLLIDMSDVLYVSTDNRMIVYHTRDAQYYHLTPSLSNLSKHLENEGFLKLDRINLVNKRQIKKYDDSLGKVYFDYEVSEDSKFATVSFLNKNKLKKEIETWITKNLNTASPDA